MTHLLLVRHGETDWNADGRLQGHTDRPLSDFGREQARRLAEEIAGELVDAVYASDLARASETAEIVAARLRLPTVLDPDLREKNWGNWEGLTSTERAGVESEARRSGVAPERLPELLLAIDELAINALTHGGGEAVLRMWTEEHDFVCELADSGPGFERRYAGYVTPTPDDLHGRGLWLARQITDLVQVRSGPNGTRIRVRVRHG